MGSILFKNRHWKMTLVSILGGIILAHLIFTDGSHTVLDLVSPRSGQRELDGHRAQIVARKLDGSLVHHMTAEDHVDVTNSKLGISGKREKTDSVVRANEPNIQDDVVVGAVSYNIDNQNHKKGKTNDIHTSNEKAQRKNNEIYDEVDLDELAEVDAEKEKPKPGDHRKRLVYYFDEPDLTEAGRDNIFYKDADFIDDKKNENSPVGDKDTETVAEENVEETGLEEDYQKSEADKETVSETDQKEGPQENGQSIFGANDIVTDTQKEDDRDQNLIFVKANRAHAQGREVRRMKKVILLSYMRSGSSYLGSLLEKSPEVFYFYEPLYSTQINFGHWERFRYLDGHKISEPVNVETTPNSTRQRKQFRGAPEAYFRPDSVAVRTLDAALGCRLHDLDLDTLVQVTMGLSSKTADLRFCAKGGLEVKDLSVVGQCCKNASATCRKTSTVVAKVIRLSMQQTQAMMEEDEDVKLIHLIRDPRGMSISQVYRRFYPWEFRREVGNFCTRIWQDLQLHAKLAQAFPFRTLLVRYEDIVKEPIKAMQQIYDLIGIHFGPLLQKQTLSMSINKNRPHAWRTKIEAEQAALVEKGCATLFHTMGYKEFPDNSSINNVYFDTTDTSFAEGWPGAVVLVGDQSTINFE